MTRRFTLDPAHSTVEFGTKDFWSLITVGGHFDRFAGSYTVGPEGRAIELTIDADSLDTGNTKRDKHLRSADFFDVEAHPQVRFHSAHVSDADGGKLHVDGELEAAGKTVPLSFDASVREDGEALEIEATPSVNQRLFGMNWSPLGTVRTPSTLHVKGRVA